MKKLSLYSLALPGLAVILAASVLKADQPAATPVANIAQTPPANAKAAVGMVEKKENAVIKAALQPLRDKLIADRQALKTATASGDAAALTAAKAAVKEDLTAIREKRVELEKSRNTQSKSQEERSEKKATMETKSDEHRQNAENLKLKAQEHAK